MKKLCDQRRQDFIDCMYRQSKCVQAGHPFQHCLDTEGIASDECRQRWREWLRCRQQAYDPRVRFRGIRDR